MYNRGKNINKDKKYVYKNSYTNQRFFLVLNNLLKKIMCTIVYNYFINFVETNVIFNTVNLIKYHCEHSFQSWLINNNSYL